MADIKKAMGVFEKRGFDVSFFETKEEAVSYLKEKITKTTVAFGGSATVSEMGLYDALGENNTVNWHGRVLSNDARKMSMCCKVYILSANAITETGEIINIDGTGNRIASSLYGHDKVYFIVGVNKLTPDLESGLKRAKNVAAPLNARRLKMKTPCAEKADKCYECDCPDKICGATCIIEKCMLDSSTEIVFINENLGY